MPIATFQYARPGREVKETSDRVFGVDDFAIKKGHAYKTGIHSLKGETMLDLLPGRNLEELHVYTQAHPELLLLTQVWRQYFLTPSVSRL